MNFIKNYVKIFIKGHVKIRFLVALFATIILLLLGFALDYHQYLPWGFPWLPRMGAVIVVLGLTMEGANLLQIKDGKITMPTPSVTIPPEADLDKRIFPWPSLKDHHGFYFAVFGTFIWGFGDIISEVI